ncbi:hypothetical protein DAT35_37775 [Vitiosangium sp. GDMCC 1.1324]|nr:hypothetical protein DAT35_37775 [Vitiosangium sp. GDMCC 1.1324]
MFAWSRAPTPGGAWCIQGVLPLRCILCPPSPFVGRYNSQHRHSAIRFVTQDDRHFGREVQLLAPRDPPASHPLRCLRFSRLLESASHGQFR